MTEDLYHNGDVDRYAIADYPGSILRIYKSQFNGLPWPLWQMLVLPNHKLVYNPIAKCGSSSLVAAIIAMSNIPNELKARPLDTHTTGLQLGDLEYERALEILHDCAYMKFGVIRDPFDRLVSAYLEKLVVNRMSVGNQFHTRNVIAAITGRSPPSPDDFARSISFSEFVDFIVSRPPESLDPHWSPQYLYLRSAIHRVFRLADIDEMISLLFGHVAVPRRNSTRITPQMLPDAYRLRASEIPHGDIATECFYNARFAVRLNRTMRSTLH